MTELSETERTSDNGTGSLRRALAVRDFRLLLGGTTTSLLGDQFALIATPWLVLQLTDDPLALGIVLALEGVPRAAFMLVGGAVTDRLAPRRVMLVADLVRGGLVAAMASVVLAGAVEMWMLYGFAFGFGLVAGFAVPAENSIVPALLRRDDLQTGNAVMMGAAQLAGFVGPTLAGAAIALDDSTSGGVGIAYAFDAATFAVSAAAFALIRAARSPVVADQSVALAESISIGIRHIWDDPAMRFVVSVLAAANLFVVGPLLVGIPLLAHDRLAANAAAFGVLMGAFAIGNLGGLVVAASTGRPSSATMRAVVVGTLGAYGVVVMSLGAITHLGIDAVLLAALGGGNGYLAIVLFTWVQGRTPPELLGRTVSIVTFAGIGLVSVSQAAAGAVARWDLDVLFAVSGAFVLATTVRAATHPGLRALTDSLDDARPTSISNLEPIPEKEPTP